MENSRKEICKRLQKIFCKHGGRLPSCAEDLYQSDRWSIAPEILEDICNEFDLYAEEDN